MISTFKPKHAQLLSPKNLQVLRWVLRDGSPPQLACRSIIFTARTPDKEAGSSAVLETLDNGHIELALYCQLRYIEARRGVLIQIALHDSGKGPENPLDLITSRIKVSLLLETPRLRTMMGSSLVSPRALEAQQLRTSAPALAGYALFYLEGSSGLLPRHARMYVISSSSFFCFFMGSHSRSLCIQYTYIWAFPLIEGQES